MNETFTSIALLAAFVTAASTTLCNAAQAETFTFGGLVNGELRNGLDGGDEDTSYQVTEGDITLSISAGPAGSRLSETRSGGGLGISSPAGSDPGPNISNVLTDDLAGVSEYFSFSFDKPGVLTGVNFDGISDDTLECFVLESPGKTPTYFFDVDSNNTVSGAVDRAVELGIVNGHVVYLLDDPPDAETDFNDEIYNLQIPFGPGQEFTMTYRELKDLGPGYEPAGTPNGSRFQQFVVTVVPEPATAMLALGGWGVAAGCMRRRRVSD